MGPALLQELRESPGFPPLPDVALRALELTEQSRSSNSLQKTLSQIVGHDPELSSKILLAVNSGFYKVSRTVADTDDAIGAMGLRPVQILVVALSMTRALMAQNVPGFDQDAFWKRNVLSAAAARAVAETLKSPHIETCFLIGLLMDMGMLWLSQLQGPAYAQLLEKTPDHEKLCAAETAALGTTHAEAAGAIAQRWKLSAVLRVPMTAHHDPSTVKSEALRAVSELVCLAGRCADVFLLERPTETLCEVRRIAHERFGISQIKTDAMLCGVGKSARDLATVFDLPVDEYFSFESALERAADDNFVAETTMPGGVLPKAVTPSERRCAKRISRDGFISIYPRSGHILGSPIRVGFNDVSSVGIGLKVVSPMPAGMQFIIKLPQGDKLIPVLYKVMHCHSLGKGAYRIGAQVAGVLRENNS